MPAASLPAPSGPMPGASWISRPTPWPSPWEKCSACPAAATTSRQAEAPTPARAPPVGEGLGVPGRGDHVAGGGVDDDDVGPDRQRRPPGRLGCRHQLVDLALRVGDVAAPKP